METPGVSPAFFVVQMNDRIKNMIDENQEKRRFGLNPKWRDISPAQKSEPNEKLPVLKAADEILQIVEASKIAIDEVHIDALTRIKNRKFYEEYKLNIFDKERDDRKIAIIVIDLDDFKDVNDEQKGGHAAGDKVLKEAATFFSSIFRGSDQIIQLDEVIRIGGDEFVIICRNDSNDSEFEKELKKRMQLMQKEKNLPFKFSFGVAVYHKDLDFDLEQARARADREMYVNKERKGKMGILERFSKGFGIIFRGKNR